MVEYNLIDMLPPSTKRMKEEQEIQRVLSVELNRISYYQYRIQQNANIPSCDEYGISVFESDMRIAPPSSDTLEQRITRCIMVWNNELPYNWASLINLIDNIIGKGNYTAVYDKLMLTIMYSSANVDKDELFYQVRERIPTKVGLSVIYRVKQVASIQIYAGNTTYTVKTKAMPIKEGYQINKILNTDIYNGVGIFNKKKGKVKE